MARTDTESPIIRMSSLALAGVTWASSLDSASAPAVGPAIWADSSLSRSPPSSAEVSGTKIRPPMAVSTSATETTTWTTWLRTHSTNVVRRLAMSASNAPMAPWRIGFSTKV